MLPLASVIVANESPKCPVLSGQQDGAGPNFQVQPAQEFNDSAWPQAYEQPEDCCPWRDPMMIWERVNAHWIGPSPSDYPLNISGPRTRALLGQDHWCQDHDF